MAKRYRRSYFRRSFRKRKITLYGFFQYWILPTLGVVIPVIVCLASKGYLSITK